MAKGFLALRFRSGRASTPLRPRRKEMLVARRNHHQPPRREIRVTFEPTRLSPSWVAEAYEHLVPLIRRRPARSSRPSRDTRESLREGPEKATASG